MRFVAERVTMTGRCRAGSVEPSSTNSTNRQAETSTWTFLDEAADSSQIVPGAHVIAGSGEVRAVVVVDDVSPEGIVHVCDVPGSVASKFRPDEGLRLDTSSVGVENPLNCAE